MAKLSESDLKIRAETVARQCNGILPQFEAFYIHSIAYAADSSESAFKRFDKAIEECMPSTSIVSSIHEALTQAGALSRFFWPMKTERELSVARGKRLRDAFNLDDSSPLKWRKLRNSFEHFDEDLDRFLLKDLAGTIVPSPLVSDHVIADEPTNHIFKMVDPRNGVCVVLGEKFEFQPIRREVHRVLSRAHEMAKRGHL